MTLKMKKASLYYEHKKLGAKFTEFGGWEMPVYYTSIIE
jgi:aminomethyltransferase